MTGKTAVGLCTLLIAVGCAERDDGVRRGHDDPATAAQIVSSSDRPILGSVRGTYDGKPFTAVLTVTRFVVQSGELRAAGTLGSVVGELADATVDALESQTHHFPVVLGPAVRPQVVVMNDAGFAVADGGTNPGTFCDVLYVRLAPLRRDVLSLPLALEAITLDVDDAPNTGKLLCTVADLLDSASGLGGPTPANLERAAELLNQLLDDGADGGREQPAVDAGRNPVVSVDASIPIRF